MTPGNGLTESTARLALSIGGPPFEQTVKEACNDGSKLKIDDATPKPSFGPISTNHLGSSKLRAEHDHQRGS
jgi:hypothetical protein